VIGIILDEAEKRGWPDSFKLPNDPRIHPKSVANPIGHFHREHKILEFSVNGDRLIWGPPGTVKRKAKGIAKMRKRKTT
jgi:hypothetical protein